MAVGDSFAHTLKAGAKELGISMASDHVELYLHYFLLLMEWNRRHNITAVKDQREAAIKLFLDSLAPLDFLPTEGCLLDVGSGGGFPGIPIKIALPVLTVHLVESSRKKVSFQKQVILELGLKKIYAHHMCLGEDKDGLLSQQSFDVVISRAVGPLWQLAETGLPYLKPEGIILAMKGPKVERELSAIEKSGLRVREIVRYRLPLLHHPRSIVILNRR